MKNIHNAVSDALETLGVTHRLREQVETFENDPLRTVVRLYCKSTNELRLEFEVLEDDTQEENHTICLLQRNALSRRSADRILDTVLDIL